VVRDVEQRIAKVKSQQTNHLKYDPSHACATAARLRD